MKLVVLVALLVACAPRSDTARGLPAERGADVHYVALGDSTVEGVGASRRELNYVSRIHARLRERYPAARLRNLGVSGATSADVRAGQLGPAVEVRPRLVTLSVGPNDITRGVPVQQYEGNIRSILESLTGKTPAIIVVNLLPDLSVTRRFGGGRHHERVARLSVEFNEALRRTAQIYGAEVVDLYSASRDEVPRRPELLSADGYHPSDAGYARWAELMWQGIEKRMNRGG
ncbi:MAG TPA: SGNH/GDSL hydrolase family protein [Methylomirabilota bacterium]|nr:SGNH/GDSL hydrolase family protein [Methylomirabilota bacterium]